MAYLPLCIYFSMPTINSVKNNNNSNNNNTITTTTTNNKNL